MESAVTSPRPVEPFLDRRSDSAAPAKKGLARRALLGTLGGLLNQGAILFTGLVLTPITATLLGQSLFGVWTMILQISNYLALGEFRVASVLKYQLASQQHSNDWAQKRRLVGASVLLLGAVLPLILLVTGVVVWQAPAIFKGVTEHSSAITWALAIIGGSVMLTQLFSVPGGVMRGENLDYKAMWLRSTMVVVTGLVGVSLLLAGWGLVGLAVAVLLRQIIYAVVWQLLACRHVPWYGVARPQRGEVRTFTRGSVWVFFSGLGYLALSTSDVILAGIILEPSAAAIYYITGSLLRFLVVPLSSLNIASGPGIAGLCGARDWPRLQRVMHDYVLISQFYLALVGVVALTVNSSFINLWLNQTYDGGLTLLLLLLGGRVLLAQLETDGNLLDGMLCFRQRALVLVGGAALALTMGLWAGRQWGLVGMAMGPLVGHFFALALFKLLIARSRSALPTWRLYRPRLLLAAAALWAGAWLFGQTARPASWMLLVLTAVSAGALAFAILYGAGLDAAGRSVIHARCINVFNRLWTRFQTNHE